MHYRRQLFLNIFITVFITVLVAGCGCDKKSVNNSTDEKISISNLVNNTSNKKVEKIVSDVNSVATTKVKDAEVVDKKNVVIVDKNESAPLSEDEISKAIREKEDQAVKEMNEKTDKLKDLVNADFLPNNFIFVVGEEDKKKNDELNKIKKFKEYSEKTLTAQYIKHINFNVRPIGTLKNLDLLLDGIKNESMIEFLLNRKFFFSFNEIKTVYEERFSDIPAEARPILDAELAESIKKELSLSSFERWLEAEIEKFDNDLNATMDDFLKNKSYIDKIADDEDNSIITFLDMAINGKKVGLPIVPTLEFCTLIAPENSDIYKKLSSEYQKALDDASLIDDQTTMIYIRLNKEDSYTEVNYKQYKNLPDVFKKYTEILSYFNSQSILSVFYEIPAFDYYHYHNEYGKIIQDKKHLEKIPAHIHNSDGTITMVDSGSIKMHTHSFGLFSQPNINDQQPIVDGQQPQEDTDDYLDIVFDSFIMKNKDIFKNYYWIEDYYKVVFIIKKEYKKFNIQLSVNSNYFNKLNDLFIKKYIEQAEIDDSYEELKNIKEEDLKAYYTKNIEDFYIKEIYHLSWLIFDDKSGAEEYFKRLETGEIFDALVKEKYGVEKYTPAAFSSDMIIPKIKNLLDKKEIGDYTSIININDKYVIAKIINKVEARPVNYDYVKEQIAEKIVNEHREEFKNKILINLYNQIQYKIKDVSFNK